MDEAFIQTMKLTFKLAFITTVILLIIGIPLGYYLSQTKSRFKPIIEAFVSMPLVLPPSVLGFYLLLAFSPKNAFGEFLQENFDIRLVFSFEGLVIASIIFSLPFMVHPIQSGFSALSKSLKEASYTLGKSTTATLWYVLLPNIKSSLLSASVITFAHTVGEFGVVLMIGGNIAGETKVASIAIYDEVESLNYAVANQYAFTLFIITFAILLFVYGVNKNMVRGEFK
ncbi:MAG: molybdate ABC transporter permease subunit [Sulfurimonas sp.]|jgi:molybdate transport system permease protein|uniref:molybdate ABC transporter permease subunit n=1 Tax=unclassified Sulfurimonas TaxID=2623549 RepID=UPI0008C8BE0E|nr:MULTISPECIES: molybdate ABC transporter permease subunit [unclassified Sulfurimonas]MBS4067476.1 molybdate ABC transporter permease subunit [Sulfurimonas sp.]MDD3854110.1 molybdate ABC transporter permease subunit [Sulfurimonas sp.]OHE04567.1 MAG: molybdenum ABC transporter permease subunit [Sulfurimonas sp. RIFOXYB12_FULL_35_9]OHE20707.1 MAG: molybdenum ABC transporter permease subunit [Sulfurimonas sp. RIFOXYD2_FULL_37_8]